MDNQSGQRDTFKAVILGDSGVGKTALVTRWTTGSFSPQIRATVGANHQRKRVTIDKQEVDIFLWDTAGQEVFQALTPLYARSSSAAIITTSVDLPDSFKNIDKWIELLNTSTEELPPIILAVNKVDLESERVVTTEEGQDYADKKGLIFYEVSAKTGEGIDMLFRYLTENLVKRAPQKRAKPRAIHAVTVLEAEEVEEKPKTENNSACAC